MIEKDVFDEMIEKWPSAVVARSELHKFTGGGISPKTLANADSEGTGPNGSFIIGRRICYPVKDIIEWLREKSGKHTSKINGMRRRRDE